MPGFDTGPLMRDLELYGVAVLVALTALGTWAYCQGAMAWYRWRMEEAIGAARSLRDENARLRRVLSAYEGARDE